MSEPKSQIVSQMTMEPRKELGPYMLHRPSRTIILELMDPYFIFRAIFIRDFSFSRFSIDGKRVVDVKYYTNVTTTTRVETSEKKVVLSSVELKDKEIQADEVSEDESGDREEA